MKAAGITLALYILILGGCATMNEAECVNADWRMIGMEDGARGRAQSYIGQHRRACAKYNITPDLAGYQAGHDEGLKEYCTKERGFEVGKKGGRYNGVCPPNLQKNFLVGYNAGNKIYKVENEIRNLTSSINNKIKDSKKLKEEVALKEQQLVSDQATQEQRKQLLAEIKEIEKKIGRLDADILDYEQTRKIEQSKLQALKIRSFY